MRAWRALGTMVDVEEEVISHRDVTTLTVLVGDIRNDLRFFRRQFEKGDEDGDGNPEDGPGDRRLTAEDRAAFDATTRLLEEWIAYHERMSELLGERERERERIAELERQRRGS